MFISRHKLVCIMCSWISIMISIMGYTVNKINIFKFLFRECPLGIWFLSPSWKSQLSLRKHCKRNSVLTCSKLFRRESVRSKPTRFHRRHWWTCQTGGNWLTLVIIPNHKEQCRKIDFRSLMKCWVYYSELVMISCLESVGEFPTVPSNKRCLHIFLHVSAKHWGYQY